MVCVGSRKISLFLSPSLNFASIYFHDFSEHDFENGKKWIFLRLSSSYDSSAGAFSSMET